MSEAPAPANKGAAAKPRSPVERAIVWGIILVLVALVGVEASSRFSFERVDKTLNEKLQALQESDQGLTKKDVDVVMEGKVPVTEELKGKDVAIAAHHVDKYAWFSLNPFVKRELYVYYGHKLSEKDEPEVLLVDSKPAKTLSEAYPSPTPEQLEEMKKNAPQSPTGMGAGGAGMMPPAGGPPGGRSGGEKAASGGGEDKPAAEGKDEPAAKDAPEKKDDAPAKEASPEKEKE